LAESEHPILVFSSSTDFLEAYVVEGYVQSGKAKEKSIIMLYPRNKDPKIHGDFAEQSTQPRLFDPRIDIHPRWEASYYQSLPDVEGLLLLGGGHATLVMGLMALANKTPIVSLATFGGNAEEIWAMMADKPWIETVDRQEMGRGSWSDDRAPGLVASLARQRAKLDEIQNEKEAVAQKRQQDRSQRSRWAVIYGVIAAALTALGVFGSPAAFGENVWLVLYAFRRYPDLRRNGRLHVLHLASSRGAPALDRRSPGARVLGGPGVGDLVFRVPSDVPPGDSESPRSRYQRGRRSRYLAAVQPHDRLRGGIDL
jgi:hypothetical protein